jgi:RNA polymerase sigma-70 factor (ECF subfamily)
MASRLDAKTQAALTPVPAWTSPLDVDAVFRRYARYVAVIARSLLRDEQDTDDVIQEVFLEAVRGLARLREPEAVRGWLATVTVRLARQKLRRRRLLRFVPWSPKKAYDSLVSDSKDPEQGMFLTQVYAALDDIPVEQRLAWTLRHMDGERLDVVARLCGCSLATAKRRIAAAHEHLQKVVTHG